MKHPHLFAALTALFLLAAVLGGGVWYAVSVETAYLHVLANKNFPQKRNGLALQRLALETPDLLPIYGSSELNIPDPFRADKIFRLYPTGFNVFTLAGDGAEPLEYLQMLAGAGSCLRGKQVVISLSPQFFIESQMSEAAFLANFSRLHAYGLALADLPWDLKQRAARRILAYPRATAGDPLLTLVLQALAEDTPVHRAGFALLVPIAFLQKTVLEIQDHRALLTYIWNHPELETGVTRRAQALDWDLLQDHAVKFAREHATNNSFGIDNEDWRTRWRAYASEHKNDSSDVEFLTSLKRSQGWGDLTLLVQTMHALGAKPLLVSMPLPQRFWAHRGVSPTALENYYERMHALAAAQQVPLVTFREFQNDKYFLRDPAAHLSATGWIAYSRVLDTFFHDRELPAGTEGLR